MSHQHDSRKRINTSVEKLPINFMVKACVEAQVVSRGEGALDAYRSAEEAARTVMRPCSASSASTSSNSNPRASLVAQLRPAWNWFKWTAIIVTEFGAFLVSMKEVLEAAPNRTRRYQRIV